MMPGMVQQAPGLIPGHPGVRNSTTGFASYYFPANLIVSTSTATVTANRLYLQPFIGLGGLVINRIGIEITTGAAGAARLGLYAMDRATGNGGVLIIDAGTVDTTTGAPTIIEASISDLVLPNVFWAASVFNATPVVRSGSTGPTMPMGVSTPNNGSRNALIATFTYDVLPSPATAPSGYTSSAPVMFLRYV